jgi:hypothetical protein
MSNKDGKVRIGFVWVRIETSDRHFAHGNRLSIFIKCVRNLD